MTIVDIHPHIISPDTARYPIAPVGGKRSDWSEEHAAHDLEELISSMNAAGVDKAAVVHSSTTYGSDCSYLADSVAQHPDRLTGVFTIDVLAPDAVDKMAYWLSRGLTGMRIFSRGSTIEGVLFAIDDPRIDPCYRFAVENEISIVSNVKVEKFAQLESVMTRHPDVKVIVDHTGNADWTDGAPFNNARPLFDMARFPNFHLKLTSRSFVATGKGKSTPQAAMEKLVSVFGADRLAWGSNFPASSDDLPGLVKLAQDGIATLSSADQAWIMGGTALRLYPALARVPARA